MELHQTIRDLVTAHGTGILADATGFRGVLDDVLDDGAASTGDINLLVDAVRFGTVDPLSQMIDGGADPGRAVEEAGARLARDRGGDDTSSASWAAAVLGYAVGKVPDAVVQRYRSQRGSSGFAPPSGAPAQSPPAQWQGQPAQSPPAQWQDQPAQSPPAQWSSEGGTARKKPGKGVLIGGAVALLVVVGGGIAAAIGLSGSGGGGGDKPSGADLSASALDQRYSDLGTSITRGTSDCKAADTGSGLKEQVTCTESDGTLTLITYTSLTAFKQARKHQLDGRVGSLTRNTGQTAYYAYDPDSAEKSNDPGVVYWDSESDLQSATLTGTNGVKLTSLTNTFDGLGSNVSRPSGVQNSMLDKFMGYWVDESTCKPHPLYDEGASEELVCELTGKYDDIAVLFGRFRKHSGMLDMRRYYAGKYEAASTKGSSGRWHFKHELDFYDGGASISYKSEDSGSAVLYWDWDEHGCNCFASAIGSTDSKGVADLQKWWQASYHKADKPL